MVFSTIGTVLESQANSIPNSVAIETPGDSPLSYQALNTQVKRIASSLQAAGVQPDARIALVMPNGADMSIALLASAITAVCIPLNPLYGRKEYDAYFAEMRVSHVLLQKGYGVQASDAAKAGGLPVYTLTKNGQGVCFEGDASGADGTPLPSDKADRVAVVMLTSGSTSQPKKVPLTHHNLCTSVEDVCRSLNLGPEDRCLSMWEQHHIGGISDLLLAPLASGGSIISAGSVDVQQFFELLDNYHPTWFQAVPTTLHAIVRVAKQQGRSQVSSSLRFVRSVAAGISQTLKDEVEDLFGIPVIQTFGMTEAAPLITSTRLPPAINKPESVGPSAGPNVAILRSTGICSDSFERGEVVVSGPNVMSGYEDAPELNEESFIDGWFRTGDVGYLDEDGELFLVGRVKELINRGGEKISPQEVEDALQTHPMVEECAVFGLPHLTLGEEVAAAIVEKGRAPLNDEEVQAYLACRLAPFKLPSRVFFVEKLPYTSTGKIERLKIAAQCAAAPGEDNLSSPPRTPLQAKLMKIWKNVLQVKEAGVTDDFQDLGGDSLAGVDLLSRVQKELGYNLPFSALRKLSTVAEMADTIESGAFEDVYLEALCQSGLAEDEARLLLIVLGAGNISAHAETPFIKLVNATGTRTPLIWCFNSPEAEMRAFGSVLPGDQPLYGLYSGSGRIEYTKRVTRALAAAYADTIQHIFPDGPFFIGGNCRGADVAIEMAVILEKSGCSPSGLCLVDFFRPEAQQLHARQQILIGRNSRALATSCFNWGYPGWDRKFHSRPWVDWTSGSHGNFFVSPHIETLWSQVSLFMQGEPPSSSFGAHLSRYSWLLFRSVPVFHKLWRQVIDQTRR